MRDLQGLEFSDFETKGNIILGKVEVDKDGSRNFTELEGVTRFDIQSNITNLFLKTCAKTFNIELLNTDDEYSLFDKGKSKYDHIRQGRRCKLYIGIEKDSEYYWSWIYGIIDNVSTSKSADGEMCSISGRDYVAYLSENYLKNLWWGKQQKYNIVAEQEKYDMPTACKGIYRAFLYNESTTEYDEMTLNSEFTYDWETNQLVFIHPRVPFENKTGGLWVYYFTPQKVENVVADILIEAGLLTHSEKQSWLTNSDLVTPTGKTIDRVWFDSGTSYIDAIELLTERVIYRFGVTNLGKPFFKVIPVLLSTTAKRLNAGEYIVRNMEDRIDELYNHFYLVGEEREMKRINLGVMEHDVEDLTDSGATLVGTVLADGKTSARQKELFGGSSIITRKGFKWQKEGEAEQSWYTTNSDMGLFTHTVSGLDSGTRYSWLVWAKNSLGHYAESNWNTFVTPEVEE